ncbi:hypothetical protein [Tenacibaculum ovolyticum]|uniref:hypothetical protein n=1 Tax=Tenacibaculum ovolyticum TaxID=104270 RepID=UPI003BAB1BDF
MIFGLGSTKIKSYSFQELGLTHEKSSEEEKVEYRQQYFHLFFIPFFPIKKFYGLRKEDGKLYDFTYKIENVIKDKPKTPWYSFLGFILIFIMYFSIFLNFQYKDFTDKQTDIKDYEKKALQNEKELNNLNTNHLINLTPSPSNNSYYRYSMDKLPLKVEKINGDSILLKKLYGNKLKYSNNTDILEYYFINKNLVDSIWLKKETLKRAIYLDYNDVYENKKEAGIDFFNENKKYIIIDIESIQDNIYLKFIENKYNKEELSITLINYGEPCEIIKIENMLGKHQIFPNNIKWSNQLPQYLKSNNGIGEKFYLKGLRPNKSYSYNFKIHLKNLNKEIYKFHIRKEVPKEDWEPLIKIVK